MCRPGISARFEAGKRLVPDGVFARLVTALGIEAPAVAVHVEIAPMTEVLAAEEASAGGKQVKRKLGPVRRPGSREGLLASDLRST